MTRLITIVGEGGLEPPRPEGHWHLKPARLPFRHSPQQPGEPITRGTPLPNRPIASPALRIRCERIMIKRPDLLRSDSHNSVGHAALRWADTMQGSPLARRHAGAPAREQ